MARHLDGRDMKRHAVNAMKPAEAAGSWMQFRLRIKTQLKR